MNHVSHLLLTKNHPDYAFGNFIGDMIAPKEIKLLPDHMRQGIDLHYYIDRTVDNHPLYKDCIGLLKPSQGKYAPVVMDILADFLLVSCWQDFYQVNYSFFKQEIYAQLTEELKLIPEHPISIRVQTMVERDFLESYATQENIPFVFEFLKKRAKYEHGFDQAFEIYQINYNKLIQNFKPVLSDLIKMVSNKVSLNKEAAS